MGKYVIIFFFCFSCHAFGQITFTSSFTEHSPNFSDSEFEKVRRNITFKDSVISVVTQRKKLMEVQDYLIKKITSIDSTLVFSCSTRTKEDIKFIILPQKSIENIDFYKKSKKTGELIWVRYWIDSSRHYFR